MQFSMITLLAASVAAAIAMPAMEATNAQETASLCSSFPGSSPQCCATFSFGFGIDCSTPSDSPNNINDFKALCFNSGGKKAACCIIPVAGQALFCESLA